MADVEKKITKAERFAELKAVVEASGVENAAELVEFIDAQVETLAKRAEKAAERRAAKKAEGDELRAQVLGVLTDEAQSAQAIVDAIGDPEVTKAKVIARLTQLINAGDAVKEVTKVDSNKVTVYKLAGADAE